MLDFFQISIPARRVRDSLSILSESYVASACPLIGPRQLDVIRYRIERFQFAQRMVCLSLDKEGAVRCFKPESAHTQPPARG